MRWLFLNGTSQALFPDLNIMLIIVFEILTIGVETLVLMWWFGKKKNLDSLLDHDISIVIGVLLANLVSFCLGLFMWLLTYRGW